jgi:tetratricopeptide (TPR) repeat protein
MASISVLDGIVIAVALGNTLWIVYQSFKKASARKIDRLLDKARAASGTEADTLLARACEECARRVEKKPRDAHALHQWGVALWWRAAKASRSEAEQIYEQADQKFSHAQAISPNDPACCSDRVGALFYRSALHPGDKGRRLLTEVCDLCHKRVGITGKGPYDARTLHTWGMALWWLARGEKGAEAKRLYQEADERFAKAVALEPKEADFAVDRASALVHRAALYGGDEQRQMLQRACRQCQQLSYRGKGGARMLAIWGSALCWLGATSKGEEAERYYAEAEKIAARALRIDPDSAHAAAVMVRAMSHFAQLQRGEKRGALLARVCEECARFDKAHPGDADLLESWGTALTWRAGSGDYAEADRLFAEAAEKLSLGLSVRPGDRSLSACLAAALGHRARLLGGEGARPLIQRAGELLEAVLNDSPGNYQALTLWAGLLHCRARLMPGEETARMASDAVRRFEAAAKNGANPDAILGGWGTALWALAKCVDGEESARLLREAKVKFLESETRVPCSAAYGLARICAQTGDPEECRRWLRASGEPGGLRSRGWVETEEEFAPVRECEWFQQLLAGQAG